MARKNKHSGKNKGRFAGLPVWILESKAYVSLTPLAKALLLEIAGQYSGNNNGYLSLTRDDLTRRGYKTPSSNQKAIQSLLDAGFIVRTIEGGICRGRKTCHLYAITWQPSDENVDKPFNVQPLPIEKIKDLLRDAGREPMITREIS
ncbi:hypothetical protein C4G25_RS19875 [Vibrio parahaemolyticus]|nr:hypothetical protein [Vibrio parahaemolyticus]